MDEMNQLEERLRSWTLRRPSRKLEKRLFASDAAAMAWSRLAGVFAPVAACLVLTLASWKQFQGPMLAGENLQSELVAMSMSNQSYAPYLAGNLQSTANRWDTFEWTNRGYSQSSVRSFTPIIGN